MKKALFTLTLSLVYIFALTSCSNVVHDIPMDETINVTALPVMLTCTAENKELEDASLYSNGTGRFGDPPRILTDGCRSEISYTYGQRLDDAATGVDVYDDSINGAFAYGKYFRIVEDGKNITDATGLNLKVRAMSLVSLISPPGDECYVDPLRGRFVLPRPVYWSKCESIINLTTPEVGNGLSVIQRDTSSDKGIAAGQFNSSVYMTHNHCSSDIYPLGSSYVTTKGTFSAWVNLENAVSTVLVLALGNNNSVSLGTTGGVCIDINSTTVASGSSAAITGTFGHAYIVWDNSGGLDGGKTIRVFVNGSEISTTSVFSPLELRLTFAQGGGVGAATYVRTDNIKIWNHVVSEDPSWEYSGGTGREDALHSIYRETNGYKPVLDSSSSPDSGVGYHFVPFGFAPN